MTRKEKIQAAIERDRLAEQLAHATLRANGFAVPTAPAVGIESARLPRAFKVAATGTDAEKIAATFGFLSPHEIHGASAILGEDDE